MILPILSWWLVSSLLGAIALPLTWRLFSRLPDRGYGFIRALGILGCGYIYWLGASLRMVGPDLSGVLAGIALLTGLSAWIMASNWEQLSEWVRQNLRTIGAMEVVFLLAFVAWAIVRAYNPDIAATEKPMELAFLNSTLRAPSFPPPDPWLSGYAISYYYFGYVLLAAITQLTRVDPGFAFNLGNALWFALTAVGSYSLVFNLLSKRDGKPRWLAALLGPLFVLLVSNLEGFLEILHARHMLWEAGPDGGLTSAFWTWLDVEQLSDPPVSPPSWRPSRYLWWWRASRVVRDIDLQGAPIGIQPIDEFPFFSFLLADNHPHLLALPFALLAIGFALQIYFRGRVSDLRLRLVQLDGERLRRWLVIAVGVLLAAAVLRFATLDHSGASQSALAGIARVGALWIGALAIFAATLAIFSGELSLGLHAWELGFAAWLFGGLAFLNFWDFPIYLSLLLAVMVWHGRGKTLGEQMRRLAGTGLSLGILGALFYLPWYPSFSSQAGGVLPNLVFTSRLVHFLIMFAPSFVPLSVWLVMRFIQGRKPGEGRRFLTFTVGIPLLLMVSSWLVSGLAYVALQDDPQTVFAALSAMGVESLREAIIPILTRRLTSSWTSLALAAAIGLGVILLLRGQGEPHRAAESGQGELERAPWPFVVLLIGVGALLVLGPEFIYLRDLFSVRMNTIFKLYFASWVLWSLAAAYVVTELLPGGGGLLISIGVLAVLAPEVMALSESEANQSGIISLYVLAWIAWAAVVLFVVGRRVLASSSTPREWLRGLYFLVLIPAILGSFYPLQATLTKTNNFSYPEGPTLDGTAHLARFRGADYAAIQWIRANLETGVIAEAVGGSYTDYARISAHTGFPTPLGWEFHEVQWRGSAELQGSRGQDMRQLYTTPDWAAAEEIIRRYHISYVYVGPLEESAYSPIEVAKFDEHLNVLYETQDVKIYAVPGIGEVKRASTP